MLRDAAPEDFYRLIQVFLRYSREPGPLAMLSCPARPAGSAALPGGGSSPSPVAPSILRLGRERTMGRSHSVLAQHLLYVPTENARLSFLPSFFSPLSPTPNNNYFSFLFSFLCRGAQREQSSPIVCAVSVFHPLRLMSAPHCRV